MARFRRKHRKSYFKGMKHRYHKRSSGSSGGMSQLMQVLAAGGYGWARTKISNTPLVQSISSKIPYGQIGDEIAMGGLAFVAKKFIHNPTVGKVADTIMLIEASRIGEAVATGGLSKTTESTQVLYG